MHTSEEFCSKYEWRKNTRKHKIFIIVFLSDPTFKQKPSNLVEHLEKLEKMDDLSVENQLCHNIDRYYLEAVFTYYTYISCWKK